MNRATKQESIGKRLKRLRLERNLSQRDLSGPGVSYAYISRIEAGARSPSVKALRKLAAKLEVTPEYLETGRTETLTDELIRQAEEWTNGSTLAIEITPDGAKIEYARPGHGGRKIEGPSLTEALLELHRGEQEVDDLLRQREETDKRLDELNGVGVH